MKEKVRAFFQTVRDKLRVFFRKIFCLTKSKKIRKIVWSVIGSIALLLLTIGLLTGSIASVGPRSIGILSNSVSHRINNVTTASGVYFAGLGAKYIQLPKKGYVCRNCSAKFEVEFRSTGTDRKGSIYRYPSFIARTNEGTQLNVSLFVVGELNIADSTYGYALFYDKYGSDWSRYLSQYEFPLFSAIPNIIRRVLSNINFYEVSNQKIKTLATPFLSSLDEFSLSLVSVSVQLSAGTNSTATTIGQQLYQKKAQLNFLNETYNDLLSVYEPFTNSQYTDLGSNKALRDYIVLSNTLNTTDWKAGLDALVPLFTSNDTTPVLNTTALESYLWTYFQLFYNSSFVLQSSQLQYQ